MSAKDDCQCSKAPTLIFSCSGASDVGAVADQAARKLTREGVGNMFCLAGIGGGISGMIESTKAAAGILAIDSCPIDCARKTLEKAEISAFEHLRLSDLGMNKGSTPVGDDPISQVVEEGRRKLNGGAAGGGSCCS
ncbi:MAG: putative zinc-binding protein [Deltaproteobacteria bacterium]|nr:putative zinc-binding protein [Candidatus Zymogenaceae bacterium]